MKQASMDVVKFGRLLYEKGLTIGTAGNISARVGEEIIITSSGTCKGMLDPTDLVRIDIGSGKVIGEGRPSMETPFHLNIYRAREDVMGVIHTHPVYTTVMAVADIEVDPAMTPEGLLVLGRRVPMVPYATPGSEELAKALRKELDFNDAFILAKHGAITVGKDLKEAFHRMETLEFIAQLQYRCLMLGKGNPLPTKEIVRILGDR